ncbi:MAG: hypothetical protein KatS3mg034_0240 [Vicingaceae bacterium]|nr:MAG: hypothetical protein KatS3mg034_0240 [Vicingaceae bacterium]
MRIILSFILFISFYHVFSQEEAEPTCYQKYALVFEKRGAFPVKDGTYDDVIITFRRGSSADCFLGKATVKDGRIILDELYIKFEDGTYEKIERKFKYPEEPIKIVNGISNSIVCHDDELINVMFVKHIKPKKKNYKKAPEPEFDL